MKLDSKELEASLLSIFGDTLKTPTLIFKNQGSTTILRLPEIEEVYRHLADKTMSSLDHFMVLGFLWGRYPNTPVFYGGDELGKYEVHDVSKIDYKFADFIKWFDQYK